MYIHPIICATNKMVNTNTIAALALIAIVANTADIAIKNVNNTPVNP